MSKKRISKFLAGTLAALMLVQSSGLTCVSAAEPSKAGAASETAASADAMSAASVKEAQPQLQNGTAVIPAGSDEETVKTLLGEALVANADQADLQSLEWEYYCTGKNGLLTNDAWGSVNGFTSEKKVVFVPTTFTHPALADNEDRDYQVRLAGTDTAVTLTKKAKLDSSIILNEGCSVNLPYTDDVTVDYEKLRSDIFDTVVSSTEPELSYTDVTIEYYATAKTGSAVGIGKAWMPLEGGRKDLLDYPAIPAGTQKIRISYAGTETYSAASAEADVTIAERPAVQISLKDGEYSVAMPYNDDVTVNFETLRSALFDAVVESTEPELSYTDAVIEYYATAKTGSAVGIGKAWMPLEGGRKDLLDYPAISEGTQKIRISFEGNKDYTGASAEAEVTLTGRPEAEFHLKEGPYSVGIVFNEDFSYNYDAIKAALYDAVIESTEPDLDYTDVTIEYNAALTDLTDNFKPLDNKDWSNLKKFGAGQWEIRFSWNGNKDYAGGSVTVDVSVEDKRIVSSIVLKENTEITFNMDADVMKQAVMDNMIDWEASVLPDKSTLDLDDFTMQYYGTATVAGVDTGIPGWVGIEGGSILEIGSFPIMGAGEQKIRISYKGSPDYRPCDNTEGTVNVNKAKVKVSVQSTNIYADEQTPTDFITTDPADNFDVYTIYVGATSDVTAGIYLDLPERFTDNAVLKYLDPIIEKLFGKSFTQMMNDGMTVKELRELFSTQELLDLLDTLNIDTGTFGQILEVINKMPSLIDSVNIAFGTPNRAGLYTATAVTDSPNYETGVGIGMLLVKMRLSGVKLTWNETISGGKISAADAADFDFRATLSQDGDPSVSQENVHYLYSGITSKFRIYSSTTTPPSEPGAYVMTVVTLGGNYLAAPITRSFTITK